MLEREKREKLYPLFASVFGIPASTFEDFCRRGFWDPTYRAYTFWDGDRAIANVSMFSLPLLINGNSVKAAGVQSVMTDPDHRRKGLMRDLLGQMLVDLDQAEFALTLLFTGVPELYLPFGFREVAEYYFAASHEHSPRSGGIPTRRLDFFNAYDLQLIKDKLRSNPPISQRFAPMSYASSFFFNMYFPQFQQKLYFSEELQVVLVFEVEGRTLKLYDIIGENPRTLTDIYAQIPFGFNAVELHFSPDWFEGISFEPVRKQTGNHLMVRGSFALENECFAMPLTAVF